MIFGTNFRGTELLPVRSLKRFLAWARSSESKYQTVIAYLKPIQQWVQWLRRFDKLQIQTLQEWSPACLWLRFSDFLFIVHSAMLLETLFPGICKADNPGTTFIFCWHPRSEIRMDVSFCVFAKMLSTVCIYGYECIFGVWTIEIGILETFSKMVSGSHLFKM